MSRQPPKRVSLLVRNVPLDSRPDDLRRLFENYGDVRDMYLPRDYYTGKPRGFGFVEFIDSRDAEDAMYGLDRTDFGGRTISVVMSKQSRKTPREMLQREDYPVRSSRSSYRDRSRDRGYGRDRERDYRSSRYDSKPRKSSRRSPSSESKSRSRSRSRSRSAGPKEERGSSLSPRKTSRSPSRSASPKRDDRKKPRSPVRSRSPPVSPDADKSPRRSASRSPTRSP